MKRADRPARIADERGAVLIQVAVALLALLALSAFVFDYGVMWASRGQAQNAADAGALAGAIVAGLRQPHRRRRRARDGASPIAHANLVWGQAPQRQRHGCHVSGRARRDAGLADTLRQGGRVSQSGTRKPAADVLRAPRRRSGSRVCGRRRRRRSCAGNATECLKPWAVVDRWTEQLGTGSDPSRSRPPDDVFRPRHGMNPPQEPTLSEPGRERAPGYRRRPAARAERRRRSRTSAVSSGWLMGDRSAAMTANGGNVYADEHHRAAADCLRLRRTVRPVCPASIANADARHWATRMLSMSEPAPSSRPDRRHGDLRSSIGYGIEATAAYRGSMATELHDPTRRTSARGSCPSRSSISTMSCARTPNGHNGVAADGEHLRLLHRGDGATWIRDTGADRAVAARTAQTVIGRLMSIPGHEVGGDLDSPASCEPSSLRSSPSVLVR